MSNAPRKIAVSVAVAAIAGAVSFAAPATASSAPSPADAAFVTSNQQGNLAEIALSKLGDAKGQTAATAELASMTRSDHTKLKAQLTSIGKADGATLPTAPNAMQQAVAAQLTATPDASFDLAFARAEVTGHQLALAAARKEQADTQNAQLKSYAATYIEMATPHLTMAQTEVADLGGTQQVNAGSGGIAATNTDNRDGWLWGVPVGGALIVAGLGLGLRARRTPSMR